MLLAGELASSMRIILNPSPVGLLSFSPSLSLSLYTSFSLSRSRRAGADASTDAAEGDGGCVPGNGESSQVPGAVVHGATPPVAMCEDEDEDVGVSSGEWDREADAGVPLPLLEAELVVTADDRAVRLERGLVGVASDVMKSCFDS